jgi:hypothetical protein
LTKSKDKNAVEYQKSIIRSLKKQVRQLQQALNKSGNNIGIPDSPGDELEEEKTTTCSNCGKGIVLQLIVANRIFNTCSVCDFRSKGIKIEKDKP